LTQDYSISNAVSTVNTISHTSKISLRMQVSFDFFQLKNAITKVHVGLLLGEETVTNGIHRLLLAQPLYLKTTDLYQ